MYPLKPSPPGGEGWVRGSPEPRAKPGQAMAYDPATTTRLHTLLGAIEPLTEKRMMGGVCFMWGQHMLCGADRPKNGVPRFLFRVGPAAAAEALAMPGVAPMEMAGRRMTGYVFVDATRVDDAALATLIALAQRFVATLPAKVPSRKRSKSK